MAFLNESSARMYGKELEFAREKGGKAVGSYYSCGASFEEIKTIED